jgi:CHAT domain-containing protein
MYGKGILLAAAFLMPTFLDYGNVDPLARITRLYRQADSLFRLTNNTPATDSQALTDFQQVIDGLLPLPDGKGKDTLLSGSYLKKGILLDSRYDFAGAKSAYCQALNSHWLSDSLTYVTHIYAGTCYYNLNNFDSARYFLLSAESTAFRYKDPDDEVRLYNILGVLYHDNGNYEQGKNYFDRALEIVKGKRPFDTLSATSLETNIATSYYHLGLFRESLEIYHQILTMHGMNDPVYMNMGLAYAALDKYKEAMSCYRKVDPKQVPNVLNEMGHAELQLHRPDSAAWWLDQLPSRAATLKLNELDLGTNDLYRAQLLADGRQYLSALQQLQQAIIIFSRTFNNPDIYANPANFTGTFASYRLFDALLKKATLFEELYKTNHQEQYLVAAYAAYKTTLSILRYIEKSFDTDDAKLFLKKRNSTVSQGAVSVCLQLYRLHPEADYLEQAFQISEKNKASVITANLQDRNSQQVAGVRGGLLQQEDNLKYNIARLNVKLEGTSDKKDLDSLSTEKSGYEIELSRLQKELEQNGAYYKLKYEDSTPGIRELQRHLTSQQALISCYLTPAALHIFVLTSSTFAYTKIDSLALLQEETGDWLTQLKTTENGKKFRGAEIGERLSRLLVKPIQALAGGKEEWIIVPDGFLYFLPFESLPSGSDALLATTTISYQFASRLIVSPDEAGGGSGGAGGDSGGGSGGAAHGGVLAFAPFADHGHDPFPTLPASRQEIAGLSGRQYVDSQATKAAFLKELNQYPIVHLATHAVSSIQNAAGSFVAFYPQMGLPLEDNLYLEELYGLDMHATQLVVISACETGQGEVVSNEGVISLARAFAYAGCAASLSSLWKADDQATSFILQRFYLYLQKGDTKPMALRQAKLDYLASGTINKSPGYWAHLVLIGDTAPLYHKKNALIWGILAGALCVLLCVLLFKFFVFRNPKVKR